MLKIVIMKGDGIGPEVISAAQKILSYIVPDTEFIEHKVGHGAYLETGCPLPDEVFCDIEEIGVALLGAVTSPPKNEYPSVILTLRQKLDLCVNIRPVIFNNIDIIIFRENKEGLYAGKEYITDNGVVGERIFTKRNLERFFTICFKYIISQRRKRVICGHKSNVLRKTDGFFLDYFYKIAEKYPGPEYRDSLIDSLCYKLVRFPEMFDSIVTSNMFGDIISDIVGGIVGGLGLLPSGNINEKYGIFEPVHGSAPDIAGKNIANPTGAILSAAMLLDYIGYHRESEAIKKAVRIILSDKRNYTADMGGTVATDSFTEKILETIKYLTNSG